MIRTLGFITIFAALAVACGGDSEPTGPAGQIASFIPATTFKGHTEKVVVVGDGTDWRGDVNVDFGAGVVVESVAVKSPTALEVTISTSGETQAGRRQVVVSDATGELTLSGFEIREATETASLGTVAQGSLSVLSVKGLDTMTPFDTTKTGDGLFTPIEFTNIAIAGLPAGVSLDVADVQPYQLQGSLAIDVDVPAGDYTFDVVSGPPENQITIPVSLTVEPRDPVALAAGAVDEGSVTAAFDSQLYEIDVSPGDVAQVSLATESSDQSLQVLPASGRFSEVMDFGDQAMMGPGTYFVVLWDNAGGSDFGYTLSRFGATLPTAAPEAEPNDDSNSAQVLAMPGHVDSATMSSSDADVFSVEVTGADMGKVLHVGTFGADRTDTIIEILRVDPEGGKTSFATSGDLGFQDSIATPPLDTPGTYLIVVSPSDFYQDGQGLPTDYSLAVWAK